MIRCIVFLLVILAPSASFAVQYTVSDFYYYTDSLVPMELTSKVYLPASKAEKLNDVVASSNGIILDFKDHFRYGSKVGVIINTKTTKDELTLLNKFDYLLPVVKIDSHEYVVTNSICLAVSKQLNYNLLVQHLTDKLKTNEFSLVQSYDCYTTFSKVSKPNMVTYHLTLNSYADFKNILYLADSLRGGVFIRYAVPFVEQLLDMNRTISIDQNGIGTIGENRTIHNKITVPNTYELVDSEVPYYDDRYIFKVSNVPGGNIENISSKLVKFTSRSISKFDDKYGYTTYDIKDDFIITDIGSFKIIQPLNIHVIDKVSKQRVYLFIFGNPPQEIEFSTISVLGQSNINDIQYYPSEYHPKYVGSSKPDFARASGMIGFSLFMGLVFFITGSVMCMNLYLAKRRNVKAYTLAVPDALTTIVDGINMSNWRDKYHEIYSKVYNKPIKDICGVKDEAILEVSKTYQRNVEPDLDKLKHYIKLLSM